MNTIVGQAAADPAAAMRHAMVQSQLRPNAVSDGRVIAAMSSVARERFVPEASRAIAYRDTALPLVNGRSMNTPMATGRLLTAVDLAPTDRVLLIGAGTGYAAAILAGLVRSVHAVESDAELLALARPALAGLSNVVLVHGPLAAGHAEAAPYDVLIVDGAVEQLPAALVRQVAPGGRLASGLIEQGVGRLASGRVSAGGFGLTAFADADCVRLPGFGQPRGFSF